MKLGRINCDLKLAMIDLRQSTIDYFRGHEVD